MLPAQVGVLKQVRDLRFVVVAIGPNDVGWTDFLRYCYGVPDCADQLTQGEFDYRMAAFDRVYGDLLIDLNDLPGRPQVIVMTSYGAFPPAADCPDTRAEGFPGLDTSKIELLTARNEQLNAVLRTGAEKYGFAVADPPLGPLCDASDPDGRVPDGLGPDLQGLTDPFPFPSHRRRVSADGVVSGATGGAARRTVTGPGAVSTGPGHGQRPPTAANASTMPSP